MRIKLKKLLKEFVRRLEVVGTTQGFFFLFWPLAFFLRLALLEEKVGSVPLFDSSIRTFIGTAAITHHIFCVFCFSKKKAKYKNIILAFFVAFMA